MALQRKLQQCPAVSLPPACCCSPQQAFRRSHKRGAAAHWRVGSTLKSLDDILGSRDEQETTRVAVPETKQQVSVIKQLRVPAWAWSELAEPRVVPLATNALYYTLLVVFVSYYVVELEGGQEAADDLIARLANDHAAVADGDALRLYTCAFVSDSLQALIFGLVGMVTVASELESLLGYSTFWALLSLCVLTGSLADAALGSIPITQGPAPAVAAVAAALLAFHARNWRLEQDLLRAKAGVVPAQFMQLEADYNTRQQQQQDGAAGTTSADKLSQQQQQQQIELQQRQQQQEEELAESDLDMPLISAALNWLGIKVMIPQEGKAFVTLGGMATGVLAALREATSADAATDWPGLVAAFVAGMALGWQVAPVYSLQFVEADLSGNLSSRDYDDDSSSSSSSSGVAMLQTDGSEAAAAADILLPVLRDSRPAAAKANAVLGYAGVLFAVLGAWLLQQQGAFSQL